VGGNFVLFRKKEFVKMFHMKFEIKCDGLFG